MIKALADAYEAIHGIASWESKRKLIICLCFLFSIDPTTPLIEKNKK